jgi:hypothetical protein
MRHFPGANVTAIHVNGEPRELAVSLCLWRQLSWEICKTV